MNIDLSPIYETISQGLISIAVALIGLGVYYIRQYVLSKIKNEELRNSLALTLSTLENSVKSSLLNMGKELKEALADGVITKEELDKIKSQVKADVKAQIEPKLQERLQAHVNDLDKFLDQAIEAEIQKLNALVKD